MIDDVLIILRCLNDAWVIRETLEAVFSQKGVRFEVVAIDSGSTDGSVDVLRALQLDFMVQRAIPNTHIFGYVGGGGGVNPDFEARISLYRRFAFALDDDLDQFGPATQLVAIVPPAQAQKALCAVKQRVNGLTVIRTTSPLDGRSTWIELFPIGVSKGLTADWLASELGVSRTRTLAVGNDFNDLDLLEWAHTGFVTANAPELSPKTWYGMPAYATSTPLNKPSSMPQPSTSSTITGSGRW